MVEHSLATGLVRPTEEFRNRKELPWKTGFELVKNHINDFHKAKFTYISSFCNWQMRHISEIIVTLSGTAYFGNGSIF